MGCGNDCGGGGSPFGLWRVFVDAAVWCSFSVVDSRFGWVVAMATAAVVLHVAAVVALCFNSSFSGL